MKITVDNLIEYPINRNPVQFLKKKSITVFGPCLQLVAHKPDRHDFELDKKLTF